MVIGLNIKNAILRASVFVVMVVLTGAIIKLIIFDYIVFSASYNPTLDKSLFNYAVGYIPNSPRLLAALAASEVRDVFPDFESAEKHALEAIDLSPNNYSYRLLLARIRTNMGEQEGAEEALNEALVLSPYNFLIHWRLANLRLRMGKLDTALEHFRFAANYNPLTIPVSLDLVWQISGQNVSALLEIVRDSPEGQIKLALFLAKNSRPSEAVDIFGKADREVVYSSRDTTLFISALSEKGFPKRSKEIWLQLKDPANKAPNPLSMWNGSFETAISGNFPQFEWQFNKSEYAKIGIDNTVGHSGTNSLLLNFLGRDTTKLDNEIRQFIVLRSDAVCQLDFFVKTEKFYSVDPGVIVTVSALDKTGTRIAESKPVVSGDIGWQQMSLNFTVPKGTPEGVPLVVSIKRLPRYEYDEPTRGRIWFDDFVVRVAG